MVPINHPSLIKKMSCKWIDVIFRLLVRPISLIPTILTFSILTSLYLDFRITANFLHLSHHSHFSFPLCHCPVSPSKRLPNDLLPPTENIFQHKLVPFLPLCYLSSIKIVFETHSSKTMAGRKSTKFDTRPLVILCIGLRRCSFFLYYFCAATAFLFNRL